MRNVRCPRCKSEHRLPNDATGYTCSGCGTEWVFAKCAQCHSTFHAPARTASWTCKRCGFRNVSAPAAEPEPEPEPEREKGPNVLDRARARWNATSSRTKIIAIGAPLAVILIFVVALMATGGSGPSTAAQLAAAKQSYCIHLRELTQEQRGPAVNRAAKKIKQDAAAFRQAGDATTARELVAVTHAAKRVVAALENNKNPAAAAAAMQKAIGKAPTC